MGGHSDPIRAVSRRDEQRLLKMAQRTVGSDFPNPDRIGCPGSDALKALVRRRVSVLNTDEIVDHIATCAPCFIEYTQYRNQQWQRTIVGLISGCIALAIIGGLILWPYISKRDIARQPSSNGGQDSTLSLNLDLRDAAVERSAGTSASRSKHILKSARLDLTIQLPIGTEDGVYDLELQSLNGPAVARASGTAAWNGTAEILRVPFDLRGVAPGDYALKIQKESSGASPRAYFVTVQ